MTSEEREYESQWHLDKKIPIAIIVTLFIQTGGIIWWAASASARLDQVERAQLASSPHSDRLTRVEVKLENVERGVTEIKSLIQQWPAASPLLQR